MAKRLQQVAQEMTPGERDMAEYFSLSTGLHRIADVLNKFYALVEREIAKDEIRTHK